MLMCDATVVAGVAGYDRRRSRLCYAAINRKNYKNRIEI